MSTSSPAIVETDGIETRLAVLAGLDPESAAGIQPFLADKNVPGNAPGEYDAAQDKAAASWLAGNSPESAPDIVIAMGISPLLTRLFEMLPDSCKFLVMECDPAKAAGLFLRHPIEKLMGERRLVLSLGRDIDKVETRFMPFMSLTGAPRISLLPAENGDAASERFYFSALGRIREIIHLNIFNLNTLIIRGPQWQFNTIRNLPCILSNPGVNALDGIFRGKPAVVAGAGPSLDRIIPVLAETRNGFVLIGAATALRALRNAGIRPDLVMAVDASKRTDPQFQTECGDLYLACSSIVHPPAPRKFKGIFSGRLDANPIDNWIRNDLRADKGQLLAAGTVTATALDLAARMGCEPIISVGLDLSFPEDGKSHADNTMYDGHRLNPSKLIPTPGNYRASVLTTPQFACYIALIENYLEQHHDTGRFINATAAGAKIKGMRLIRPEALRDFADSTLDAFPVIQAAHDAFRDNGAFDAASREIEKLDSILPHISEKARLAAALCNRLIMMLRSPAPGDEELALEYLAELEAADRQITETQTCSAILEMSLWAVSYKMRAAKNEGEEHLSEGIAVHRRFREFYEQIAGSSRWTRDLLRDVAREMHTFGHGTTNRLNEPVLTRNE